MRISDWSSDVCSSDLLVFAQQRLHSGDLAAKADPREAQALEVLERDRLALHHLAGRDPRDASLEQDRIEARARRAVDRTGRSEEHTSEFQSLMRISYAVFCLQKKNEEVIRQHT